MRKLHYVLLGFCLGAVAMLVAAPILAAAQTSPQQTQYWRDCVPVDWETTQTPLPTSSLAPTMLPTGNMPSIFGTSTAFAATAASDPDYNASTAWAVIRAETTPAPENLYTVIEPKGMNVRACKTRNCAVVGYLRVNDAVRIEETDSVNGFVWGKIMGVDQWVALSVIGSEYDFLVKQ